MISEATRKELALLVRDNLRKADIHSLNVDGTLYDICAAIITALWLVAEETK